MGKVLSVCKGTSDESKKKGVFVDTSGIRNEVGADGRLPKAWYMPKTSAAPLAEENGEPKDEEAEEPERIRAWRQEQRETLESQRLADERLEAERLKQEAEEVFRKEKEELESKEKEKLEAELATKENAEKLRIAKAKQQSDAQVAAKEKMLREKAMYASLQANATNINDTLDIISSKAKEWVEGESMAKSRTKATPENSQSLKEPINEISATSLTEQVDCIQERGVKEERTTKQIKSDKYVPISIHQEEKKECIQEPELEKPATNKSIESISPEKSSFVETASSTVNNIMLKVKLPAKNANPEPIMQDKPESIRAAPSTANDTPSAEDKGTKKSLEKPPVVSPIVTVSTKRFSVLEVMPNMFFGTASALAGKVTSGMRRMSGNGQTGILGKGLPQLSAQVFEAESFENANTPKKEKISNRRINELEDLETTPLRVFSTEKFGVLGLSEE